jgi:DNA-directed RNA polymerase subunit RPC12/RpoP
MSGPTFRHRCPGCDERFPVRVAEGQPVACPRCNTVALAMPEPLDERHFAWATGGVR